MGTEAATWVTFLRLPGVGTELQGLRHRVARGRSSADWLGRRELAAPPLTLPCSLPAARCDSGSWGRGRGRPAGWLLSGGAGPAWGVLLGGHLQDGPLAAQPSPQLAGLGVGLVPVFPRQGWGHSRCPPPTQVPPGN